MSTLVGACNQCALCCMIGKLRCGHLILRRRPGSPMASRCAIYATRYDGMPIVLYDEKGRLRGHGVCAKDSPEDTANIIARGIGKGCSLQLVEVTHAPVDPAPLAPAAVDAAGPG